MRVNELRQIHSAIFGSPPPPSDYVNLEKQVLHQEIQEFFKTKVDGKFFKHENRVSGETWRYYLETLISTDYRFLYTITTQFLVLHPTPEEVSGLPYRSPCWLPKYDSQTFAMEYSTNERLSEFATIIRENEVTREEWNQSCNNLERIFSEFIGKFKQ